MLAKLSFSLRRSAWLLALLIITSALPVSADTPPLYIYELHSSGEGYIFKSNYTYYFPNDYGGVLEVPDTYNGLPIIGVWGFSNCTRITAVKFPSTVKYITAFDGCTGLTEITLPADAEEIGSFEGCTNLATVNMNNKLIKIGVHGFTGCTSLKSIVLPKTLRYLGSESFKGCTALESVTFEDGINFFYDGAYRFGTNVFEGCTNLSYVKLPETTTEDVYFNIPIGTFIDCINLKSINIPANINRIEEKAFLCSGLESLDLTPIPETGTVYLAGYYTFAGCKNLKSVKAKCNVEMAYNSQFLNCTALETVNIEGSYTRLGDAAFKGCTSLKSFKVYRLENLPDSTFAGCTSLTEFAPTYGTAKSIGTGCFAGCTSLETMNYTQHQDNMSIGEGAFSGCTALKSFYFSRITSIGKESFKGCISLSETPNFGSCYINSVGESAFEGCSSLTRLEFAYLTSVGSKAFAGCSALTTLDFNPFNKYSAPAVASEDAFDEWNYKNTVIDVPDNKYSWFAEHEIWKKFLRIKHPETLAYTSVSGGYSVGKGQYALDSDFTGMLVIPEQGPSGYVVSIAAGAFRDLTGITGVTLPKKLTSIGDEAFAGCTGITTVINKATTPIECNENIFAASVYAAATLYVPFGSLDAYKNTLPWSKFVNIKQGIGEHTLTAPVPSREPGIFNESGFDLTFTNPNETGSIYYYIVPEGDTSTGVRTVSTYSASSPLRISSTCTVVAYVYDGTNCSDPVSLTYTYEYVEPEMNLKVWVNGMEITEENCYDVLGDKGSVTYDMKSGILTLRSATINLPEKVDQAAIVSEGGALTINVDGFNYINAKTMGIYFDYAKNATPTHRICGVGKENNTLTIMLDNSYGEGDGIYAYLSNLEIENCAVTIYNSTNGIFMKPAGLGKDGKLSVLGTSVVGINANHSALTNVVALNLDKGLQILDPEGATFNPYGKEGNIFDAEGNLSGRLYIGSVEPSNINDIPNIPQGTETVTFKTYSEEKSLANNAIGDIYFSITDNTSGCDPTHGLILNAMSSLEDVAQFNSEIESSGYASNSNFNGIAVKVKGTGSVTFPLIQNSGSARLTLLLGDGTPVYGDELPGLKYEFSTAKAKYLYIFGTLKDTKSAPALKEIKPGADYVNIYSMEIEITDINGGVINTENGLDKVLAAGADDCCRINTTLFGHYHDGKYLYASTMDNSGSSKNTFNEGKKEEWWSDKEGDFNQEDWVAISGLTAEFVGHEIESGNVATVISNTAYPVISFDDKVSYTKSKGMGINTFRVANFNINAKSEAVSNIWLVAPQPAEYCTVTGYVSSKNIYAEDGYLVLQSAEGPTKEDKTVIEPLTMNVYYDQAALKLGADGWYAFTGIVSKDGDALKFTALEATDKPTGIEDVDVVAARVFAANGNINVIADAQTTIAVYSANGQLVTAVEATDATIAVAPGFYIVKVGNRVTKLAVK